MEVSVLPSSTNNEQHVRVIITTIITDMLVNCENQQQLQKYVGADRF